MSAADINASWTEGEDDNLYTQNDNYYEIMLHGDSLERDRDQDYPDLSFENNYSRIDDRGYEGNDYEQSSRHQQFVLHEGLQSVESENHNQYYNKNHPLNSYRIEFQGDRNLFERDPKENEIDLGK